MASNTPPRRVALITGGSRGIGAHLVDAFAQEGYAVAIVSRSGVVTSASGQVTGYACDVADAAAVTATLEKVVHEVGVPDVVINNAGVLEPELPLTDADPEVWRRTLEVNVLGPYHVSRAVIPLMRGRGGRLIMLNSGAAHRTLPGLSAYGASKAALARITSAIHAEEYDAGIRVFDLAPGVVLTDMTRDTQLHAGRTQWTSPSAVADLAVALASGDLDSWSGRFVRAGADTPETLQARAQHPLLPGQRTLGLLGWGADDPAGP